MLLKKLIKNLPENKKDFKIKGITVDSKKVKDGYVFFAIRGQKKMEKITYKRLLKEER